MAKHAMLNNVEHRELRVNTCFGEEFGDNIMTTLAIPSEFRNLQADYPIVLHKDEDTGKFLPMVMFGFEQDENLFLNGEQWQASYVPLMVRRGPFLIGFQEPPGGGDKSMVISVDMDNPRVGQEGERLFEPFGDNTEYTNQVADILQQIDQGQAAIEEFSRALSNLDLIEPFSFEVKLNSGETRRLEGFYTIHEEKLASLGGVILEDFAQRGILHGAYMMLASLGNFPKLIELKNRRG